MASAEALVAAAGAPVVSHPAVPDAAPADPPAKASDITEEVAGSLLDVLDLVIQLSPASVKPNMVALQQKLAGVPAMIEAAAPKIDAIVQAIEAYEKGAGFLSVLLSLKSLL